MTSDSERFAPSRKQIICDRRGRPPHNLLFNRSVHQLRCWYPPRFALRRPVNGGVGHLNASVAHVTSRPLALLAPLWHPIYGS